MLKQIFSAPKKTANVRVMLKVVPNPTPKKQTFDARLSYRAINIVASNDAKR